MIYFSKYDFMTFAMFRELYSISGCSGAQKEWIASPMLFYKELNNLFLTKPSGPKHHAILSTTPNFPFSLCLVFFFLQAFLSKNMLPPVFR
jgi:hypothetical protein